MPQSLARVLIHTVFSTKLREPLLRDVELRSELYSFMGGVANQLDCHPIRIGGMPDHVHMLTTLSRTVTIAEFVKETKRVSTDWIRNHSRFPVDGFRWQAGYGVFSVSESNCDQVVEYIMNQEEHHRRITFQEEFRAFCKKHGLNIDERYAWD